jgi:hypothetical protein
LQRGNRPIDGPSYRPFLLSPGLIWRAGQVSLRQCGFFDYGDYSFSNALEEYNQPTVVHTQAKDDDPRNVKHLQQFDDFVTAIYER